MNKLKIAWICIFTNAEVQSFLPINKEANEIASWIPNLLKGYENRSDIEIHVISPHGFLKRTTIFSLRNINYYFIPYGTFWKQKDYSAIFRFDLYSNYYLFRKKVKNVIASIQPDLINLIGAENGNYSSSILDYRNRYPTLITIQGFISQFIGEIKLTTAYKKRIQVEEKILKSFKYFCGDPDSSIYISKYNNNHVFFNLDFPVNEELIKRIIDKGKIYDCIYFGVLSKLKGTFDFIRVIAEIKGKKSDVMACIVGGGDISPFRQLAQEMKCENNIHFIGFVKSQRELFDYVKASKILLAPPYFDRLSATIREAMFLKIPIVAYATGGIPYVNEFEENIFLVKTGDYKRMAQRAIHLLEDELLRKNLAEKAYQYYLKEFSIDVTTDRFITAYKTIINDKKNYKPE